MLVLSRQLSEEIELNIPPSTEARKVTISVQAIRGDKVRLGVDADKSIVIDRFEVAEAKRREKPEVEP